MATVIALKNLGGLPDKNKFYNSLTNHEIND